MTTPSAYRRLNKAAELYMQFLGTTMQLCQTVKGMNAQLMFDESVAQDTRDTLQGIATNVERAFKDQLNPMIERLMNLDKQIRENLPDPNKRIVAPEDMS
jgi:hypothetical protein